ncbi:MAG: caspase family protein [Bradyrhizobium sp.]|nr:caspase family protein [Bradyrhizobium sp.]
MFRHALFNLVIPVALLLGAHSASAESRLALVIGQSAYKSVPVLPNPINDAKAVTRMLTDSGFEVSTASDLSQSQIRDALSEFAAKVASKGGDSIAVVFYAGHGMQIDGENFLIPVDINPKRESDIAIQAVRLNDVLNTLTSAPSKMRILMVDACRNNPFPEISRSAGGGLALIDTKFGAPNTFLSFSTSPGAVAEDGRGDNSPYTTALLAAAKEANIPIEETFKRTRVSVNKATEGRQTPWDSSSLTDDFRFSGTSVSSPKLAEVKKSVEEWTRDLKGKSIEDANEIIVADGSDESYEAFAAMFPQAPLGVLARDWVDRHRRMVAWKDAVAINSAAGYRAFQTKFPDSDLTATARKLEERLRNRPDFIPAVAVGGGATPQNVALTCPCTPPASAPKLKKTDTPIKRVDPDPPRRVERAPPKRRVYDDDDVVVVRRPPPRDVYEPAPGPSIGIGIGVGGGGGYGGRGYGGGGGRRGGY